MKIKNRIWILPLIIMGISLLVTNSCKKDENATKNDPVTDADGNVYHTVTIGTQTWMVENLRTTKYNDNTAIPNVTDGMAWSILKTPGVCTYKNTNNADTINTYGRLYNWYTVNTGKLAPTGWHVPTNDEWTTLENYLIANGYNYDGTTSGNKYAKALASATGWHSYTGTGTVGNTDYPAKRNATGFSALPGGFRGANGGVFYEIGSSGAWWSSSEFYHNYAGHRDLTNCERSVGGRESFEICGFSVRCLRD